MGETCAILGSKRNTEILNYKPVKGEDVTWKPK